MRVLLDTHVVLWWASDDPRLSSDATAAFHDDRNELILSAIVVWEVAIKRRIGKLPPGPDVRGFLDIAGVTELQVSLDHVAGVEHLPLHHRDPFDRLLVVQAQREGATVLSRDPAFDDYGIPVLW